MTAFAARRAAFRALHQSGCFVIPNPWDAGGALRLQALGFKALASTSAGAAWALGKTDGGMSAQEVVDHLRMLCAASDLPVNADFEAGFSDTLEGVAAHVTAAVQAGVAGLSIEDRIAGQRELYPVEVAVERIRAARDAIAATGEDVILVGRCEGYLIGQKDLGATIARLKAYGEAGADCLYAPGVRDIAEVRALVEAAAPLPVNVLLSTTDATVEDLAGVGVRRVSVGGALAKASWKAFDAAAALLKDEGRLPSQG
jgi:2-methylisocitrate lyase-like PEP mutase family enzyme